MKRGADKKLEPIISNKQSFWCRLKRNYKKHWLVYWMMLPIVLYYVIFEYIPMAGNIIAFMDYKPIKGIAGSKWVGFEHFKEFFESFFVGRAIKNTIVINLLEILIGFPAPIILALMFNEIRNKHYKKITQTVSYLPHFISLVVTCGIVIDFVGSAGVITKVLTFFGVPEQNLLSNKDYYVWIYVFSGVWKNIGWGSIIYLSALSGADQTLYEAASIDGAGRLHKIIHVSLPTLLPVISIRLIMRIGHIMSMGAEKTILLYSPAVYETADTIASYVYRMGLQQHNYSLATAVGMFNSLINFALVIFANWFSRKYVEESLW